ncbi:MAG: hypothetical protein VZQ55_05595 [Ruminococcus sp.]|nr:hypothetical protein [Ruminococcus sp.]
MRKVISPDKLNETITNTLNEYKESIVKGIKLRAKISMKRFVRETKATAPVGKHKKHYRDYITSKKIYEDIQGVAYLWYVKSPEYRLTHLLENGHATRNGGRTTAFHFIKNAYDPIIQDYIRGVEEVCRNG